MIEKTQGIESRPRVAIQDLQEPVRAELDRVQEELSRFFISDVPLINEISRHMMRANGKRLRPTLLLLVNRLNGPVPREAIIAATIVELVHTATLIHDDSIDRSFLRRGIPTVNSLWNDQTSVIMGDYLYSKAFFLLIEHDLLDAMKILARTTHRMSLGEMMELEHKLNFDLSEDDYYRLILDKTAVLISAACEIGSRLAWGDGHEQRILADFGTHLGMTFQITDDILDVEGDAGTMGKSTGSDIRDGKITLPLIHVLQTAPEPVVKRIRESMSREAITDAQAQEVATLVAEYGGLDYAHRQAQVYADRALELLEEFDEHPVRSTLHDAVEYVLSRRQ
jgi:octaprenyl-diphosphate synthase